MNTPHALLKLMVKELTQKNLDVIPKGYFTMHQIVKESGLCMSSVKPKVYKAVKEGKMERKMFFALTAAGNSHKLPFFKYLKK